MADPSAESSDDDLLRTTVRSYQDGQSVRQIAAALSVSRGRVRAALRRGEVQVEPRGRGRPRPGARQARPPGIEELLHEMYVVQRLSRRRIAETLDVPEHRVRSWLDESGISARSRGAWSREDRGRPKRETLERLYGGLELPAREVGRLTSEQLHTVLETLHEQGLPVRIPHSTRAHLLLDEIYHDDLVLAVLRRHRVPVVAEAGALHERFPSPVRLDPGLLRDLYEGCGLSVVHIELVTGQPADTVRRHLRKHGIVLRPAGGLSPFLRRQRGG